MVRYLALLLVVSSLAHATDPIVDRQVIGPLVQVQDIFTSLYVHDPGDGTAVVVDAGLTPFGGALLDALATIDVPASAVTDVFLTHGHSDHIAGLGLMPNARVHALAGDVPLVEAAGFTVTDVHEDGDVVELGSITVEVFAVPGHTAGSAAYLIEGVLVMGDAVIACDGRLQPISSFFSEDPALNVQSIRNLADRLEPRADEVLWFAPSHSGPAPGPGQRP